MIQVEGLALNIISLFAAWWFVRSGLHLRDAGTQLLAATLLAWGWCILGMQTLGSIARLHLGGMAVWVAIGLVVALAASHVSPAKPWDRQKAIPPRNGPVLSWSAIVTLTFLIWVILEMAFQSLLYPVKVMSDGPIYHLYFALRWWKAGKYFLVAAPFGENAATYFPANGDLWFTWLMMTWGGDRLAKIGQAPFLILAGVSAYQIARSLGAGRSAGLIATTWFLTSTALLVFSFQANVDTIFIANYLLAALFFLRFARKEEGSASLFLGGLAAGGALGTKSVAIIFIPPLIVLTLLAVVSRQASGRTKTIQILTLLLSPLILSGFWYLQNAFLTGNPLYPLRVEVLGYRVLTGWYGPGAMEQSQFYIPVGFWRAFGDILLAVLDPRLTPVWIIAMLGAWAFPRSAHSQESRWIWLLAALAVVNILLYWLLIPYRTQQRFMLQALGLAVAPLALTFDRRTWAEWMGAVLVILHITTPQPWPFAVREDQPIPWDLTPLIPNFIGPPLGLFQTIARSVGSADPNSSPLNLALVLMVGFFSAVLAWSCSGRLRGRWQSRTIPVASLTSLLIVGSFAYSPGRLSPRQLFYPPFRDFYVGWMNFDALAGPNGSRVAYAGTNIPFYLFGTGLRNEVRYINVDEHWDWLLHDYHREAASRGNEVWPNPRPGWDREHPNYASWLKNLEAERINLLVVTRVNTSEGAHNVADPAGFPIERQWADAHPERFQLLYGGLEGDPWFRIYRFLRP